MSMPAMNVNPQSANGLEILRTSEPLPSTLQLAGPHGSRFVLSIEESDRLGCAIARIEQHVNADPQIGFDDLTAWAKRVASHVTYLLETLVVLEQDREAESVQLRSGTPERDESHSRYYEASLGKGVTDPVLTLHRFEFNRAEKTRSAIPMLLTQEQVRKLLADLDRLANDSLNT